MAEDYTEVDIYEPTAGEKKLLEIMLSPDNNTLNVSEVCKLAELSRSGYYKIFKKKAFVDYYREQSKSLVSQSLGQVINACVNQAKAGSHPHIKTILEMADLHLDKIGLVDSEGKNLDLTVSFIKPEDV